MSENLKNSYEKFYSEYFRSIKDGIHIPSYTQATSTIKLFQLCINYFKTESVSGLCQELKRISKKIVKHSFPLYIVCENISKRIYKVSRDERSLIARGNSINLDIEGTETLKYILMNERKTKDSTLDFFSSDSEDNLAENDSNALHISENTTKCDSNEKSLNSEFVDKLSINNKSINISSNSSIQKLGIGSKTSGYDLNNFKDVVLDAIEELEIEVDSTLSGIANQALDHIHSDEVILTSGYSSTLLSFLRKAGKRRKFTLILAESNPDDKGHILAKKLAELKNLKITIIPDSAIFAIMPRVNKVIISTYGVCPNGTVLYTAGTYPLALAARHFSVPLFVCAGLYKLSYHPIIITNVKNVSIDRNFPVNSYKMVKNESLDMFNDNFELYNPCFDEIPPSLISLIITNIGSHQMSYIHRLSSDLYKTSAPRYNVD